MQMRNMVGKTATNRRDWARSWPGRQTERATRRVRLGVAGLFVAIIVVVVVVAVVVLGTPAVVMPAWQSDSGQAAHSSLERHSV